jgi:hypothetical protein
MKINITVAVSSSSEAEIHGRLHLAEASVVATVAYIASQ